MVYVCVLFLVKVKKLRYKVIINYLHYLGFIYVTKLKVTFEI
jgi:hypothetical protein